MVVTFFKGYPQDGSSLGASKVQIRNNLDGTFDTVAINHFDNNQGANAGKHKYIQIFGASHPGSTIANELLLFEGGSTFGGTRNLFYNGPSTSIPAGSVQLTRNEIPSSIQNGFSWLPGGTLIQWGYSSSTSSSTVITYPTPFTNSVFNLQATLVTNASTGHVGAIYTQIGTTVPAEALSKFTVYQADLPTSKNGFFWMAIGK